jgi:hypothetical protein
MRLFVASSVALSSLVSLALGCGNPSSTGTAQDVPTRALTGAVSLEAYSVDNPVVIAVSASARQFLGAVQADGTFLVTVPTGDSYRLVLASSLGSGGFQIVSTISWTAGTETDWARVDGAGAIALGTIQPVATGALHTQSEGDGKDDADGGGNGGSGSGGGGGPSSRGGGDDQGASGKGSGGDDHGDASDHDTRECVHAGGDADLPYDVHPPLGSTFQLADAFLFKGPLPSALVGVTMDGGSWRLAELQANTPFTITQADCDHQGNRDMGRDRVVVTWQNADGTTDSDHLDLRYCDASSTRSVPPAAAPAVSQHDDCEDDHTPTCKSSTEMKSECVASKGIDADDVAEHEHANDDDADPVCPQPPSTTTPPPAGDGGAGTPCTVTADCAAALVCLASTCQSRAL